VGYLLPSCHPAASCMVDMKGEGFAEAVTVVGSYSSSCKGTAVVESQAVIVCGPLAGQENYLLVNLTNNGSSSAADSATENAGL